MNIAIVGSGISGMIAAYVLQKQHDVTVYEVNDYIGGHTATVDVSMDDTTYAIDTGFIVFNDWTYPLFKKFLNQLHVRWQNAGMSFSVFDDKADFEYSSQSLNTLFAQRKNLFSYRHYKFLSEILRFNRLCKSLFEENRISTQTTLGDFLQEHRFDSFFCERYVYPMAAAIWSSTYSEVSRFSLAFFARFFFNHGLLNVNERPQWHVIRGGSREYVRALQKRLRATIQLRTPVLSVRRLKDQVELQTPFAKQNYDHVIFACHSDQVLKILADKTDQEQMVLSQIKYQPNHVVLHTDTRLLPRSRRAWASWNYRLDQAGDRHEKLASVSYNMNILQGLHTKTPFIVSLNQNDLIDPQKILRKFVYDHPIFNTQSEDAKARRGSICGQNRTHFCGAYWYNGFHEDGVRSALDVTKRFGLDL